MMKHFHKIAAMALMMLPAIAGAQNGVNYSYTHTDGVQYSCSVYTDSIIITDATLGTVTNVVIPDSIPYGGTMRPVREIGAQAFAYSDIETVVIPNTVTEIGYGAFSGSSMLTTVTIGTGVRTLWETAFEYCESLTTLNFNAISSSVYAFSGSGVLDECDALETINIGSEVTVLPVDLVGSVFPLVSLANVNIAAERLLNITNGYFGSTVSGLAITVPCSQLTAYQSDAVWSALGAITADCGSNPQPGDTTGTDTLHVTVYDTIHITVYDTSHVTVYDTSHVTVYDTIVRYVDSVYCDTLIVHDTIIIDPQVGLNLVEETPVKIYLNHNNIVVEGASNGELVSLYDMQGRMLEQTTAADNKTMFAAPVRGVYLLRVGMRAAHKIVIAK